VKAARPSTVGSEKSAVGNDKLAAGIVQWVSASLIVKARARSSMVRASGS
jgi:hypothetical protein